MAVDFADPKFYQWEWEESGLLLNWKWVFREGVGQRPFDSHVELEASNSTYRHHAFCIWLDTDGTTCPAVVVQTWLTQPPFKVQASEIPRRKRSHVIVSNELFLRPLHLAALCFHTDCNNSVAGRRPLRLIERLIMNYCCSSALQTIVTNRVFFSPVWLPGVKQSIAIVAALQRILAEIPDDRKRLISVLTKKISLLFFKQLQELLSRSISHLLMKNRKPNKGFWPTGVLPIRFWFLLGATMKTLNIWDVEQTNIFV